MFITKLELLKGYWQVPLTPRSSDIYAFVTPDHFLQYTVMALRMNNAQAMFQHMKCLVLGDVPQRNVYFDDLMVVYFDIWADHGGCAEVLCNVFFSFFFLLEKKKRKKKAAHFVVITT